MEGRIANIETLLSSIVCCGGRWDYTALDRCEGSYSMDFLPWPLFSQWFT